MSGSYIYEWLFGASRNAPQVLSTHSREEKDVL